MSQTAETKNTQTIRQPDTTTCPVCQLEYSPSFIMWDSCPVCTPRRDRTYQGHRIRQSLKVFESAVEQARDALRAHLEAELSEVIECGLNCSTDLLHNNPDTMSARDLNRFLCLSLHRAAIESELGDIAQSVTARAKLKDAAKVVPDAKA